MRRGQALTLLLGFVGLVLAALPVLLPLPAQTFDGARATCGRGDSSEPALWVKLQPNSVTEGDQAPNTPEASAIEARFRSFCQGVADTRLEWSAVLVASVTAIAVAALVFFGWRPPRGTDVRRVDLFDERRS